MMIVMVLFWLLLIAGLVWLVWRLARGLRTSGRAGEEESPETILEKRYAREEIDRGTYERMREDLGSGPTAP